MKKIKAINIDSSGCARCIMADYYKMGLTNFLRAEWGGRKDGFSAPAIVEYYEEDKADKYQ